MGEREPRSPCKVIRPGATLIRSIHSSYHTQFARCAIQLWDENRSPTLLVPLPGSLYLV
jgi:hypothetical protein